MKDYDTKMPFPWTNVYGAARSILALGTLLTLLFNSSEALFKPLGVTTQEIISGNYFILSSIFELLSNHLEAARWLSIIILCIVMIGWRPRITAIFHWWISYSFAISCVPVDGGDQATAVLTLLLLPVTLTDSRKWHWSTPQLKLDSFSKQVASCIAVSALFVIRIQVAIIYFDAGTAKLRVYEWVNGTAIYYWFTDPMIGPPQWLQQILLPILSDPFGVTLLTWGTLLLEILLFGGLFIEKRWRPYLLISGIAFHLGIILVFGLVSFFCAMTAALILLLRPFEAAFQSAYDFKKVPEAFYLFLRSLPSIKKRRFRSENVS